MIINRFYFYSDILNHYVRVNSLIFINKISCCQVKFEVSLLLKVNRFDSQNSEILSNKATEIQKYMSIL